MTKQRDVPIKIEKKDFKKIGYQLIDTIANFFDSIEDYPVTQGESPMQLQKRLGNSNLPKEGRSTEEIISTTSEVLLNHSLFNGHPKFMGYITSSPSPIGVLADLLASAMNQNCGAQILSPIATEIEKQTIQWLSEFIGVTSNYGGIIVSGGNMANFTAFLAARTAKAPKSFKEDGFTVDQPKLVAYCSSATHTWVEKAATLFGHGSKSIRWILTDADNKMNSEILTQTIKTDLVNGYRPFMVIGTAGDVSTGVVDNLKELALICKTFDLWFHIDGAYGAPAAIIPELKSVFDGIEDADSIALDPHKWLYIPLEAGCTLVKNPQHLIDTYSSHPEYYNFDKNAEGQSLNFYEYGLQNSRGFRALKVWMSLQHVGSNGYRKMISQDVTLSKMLFQLAKEHSELEAISQNLSITNFRYVPTDNLPKDATDKEKYLNNLNEVILDNLQKDGEVFLSNAVIKNRYCLRSCIVNFRTSEKDIIEVVEILVKEGRKTHNQLYALN